MPAKKELASMILKNKDLALDILGIKPFLLFNYKLSNLTRTQQQIFSHALYGSGGRESFLKSLDGQKLGDKKVVIPLGSSEELKDFFRTWNLSYEIRRIWM
ncbi:hypothetical protein KY366_02030 [Candidatus Woesearchaeota archaeon]|nr:hypothetical protein [Candidatus Woesearchaeota archaeon]